MIQNTRVKRKKSSYNHRFDGKIGLAHTVTDIDLYKSLPNSDKIKVGDVAVRHGDEVTVYSKEAFRIYYEKVKVEPIG